MTWYPDLSPCDYFRISDAQRLLAVGWLARRKGFPKGPVAPEVFAKIERLADHAPYIFVFRGFHMCELCEPQEPRLRDDDGRRVTLSSHLNIFVPHAGRIFVAPQCLPHYIAAHGYCPPQEFCDAVLHCPEPDDPALADSLRDAGGTDFIEEFERLARLQMASRPGGD